MANLFKKLLFRNAEEGTDNVIHFPGGKHETPSIVDDLGRRVEEYSEQLYAGEREEGEYQADDLMPHSDVEDRPADRTSRRKHIEEDRPDISPAKLAKRYGAGLKFLRLRIHFLFILACVLLYLTAAAKHSLPLPYFLAEQWRLQAWLSGGLLTAAMLLSLDALVSGILRIDMGLLIALSCAASAADAFTMPVLGSREDSIPYCAVNIFALVLLLSGTYLKKRALRTACRTAVTVKNPYMVTLDENSWCGQNAYARWRGDGTGFGSQIQGSDGSQRMMRIAVPLLTIASVLFAMLASLGRGRPELILWCLSAILTAAASFSAPLVFARPFDRLASRLSKSGTALGGWAGLCTPGQEILITDHDLFPAKTIQISEMRTFGSFGERETVSCAATLLREGGIGLERVFHTLLRQLDGEYCRVDTIIRQEGGITSHLVWGEVSIGTGDFMKRTGVPLPENLDTEGMLLCSIEGHLAAAFSLQYGMSPQISAAIKTLLKNKIRPVLATRDFLIVPDMLKQKFGLPVEKIDFPVAARRAELSDPEGYHDPAVTAVLYREGLCPFTEAVVGAKRLRAAVIAGTWLSIAGSVVGILMAYYLTFVEAYAALSPLNLLTFLIAWLIPAILVGGMADLY